MQALSKQEVAQNVSALQEQICQAAAAAGRDPAQVRLMAVTKTVDPELVNAAKAK